MIAAEVMWSEGIEPQGCPPPAARRGPRWAAAQLAQHHASHTADLAVQLTGGLRRPPGWRRGHEEQFATDILALLDTLGVSRCDLVGHDWGGWTAQLMALRDPGRFRSLALLNIPHVWLTIAQAARHAHKLAYQPLVATPGLGRLVQRGRPFWWFMRQGGLPARHAAEFRAAMREPGRAVAGSKVYRTFVTREVLAGARGRYDGQRLEMPTRVLFGLDDIAIHPSLLDGFDEHADDLRITTVPGCGHFIVDEQPERVIDWLRNVLAETSGG